MRVSIHQMDRYLSERNMTEAKNIWQEFNQAENPYLDSLGWLDCQKAADGEWDHIHQKAKEIRENADMLVVVGVGGSNQASRAVVDSLGSKGVEVVWLGNTLSSAEIRKNLERMEGHSVYIDVIAKNFATLEPGSHYRLLREWMKKRYSAEEMSKRFILTGTRNSLLHRIADEHQHLFLSFPKQIGGRYSAFSPVALMPLAAAGCDTQAYLAGGINMQRKIKEGCDAFKMAAWRNECMKRGFDIEMLTMFEPSLERFARWWRQLFGESEGKDGKGVFPAYMVCSEDLHAMGQYMQEGPRRMLETFLSVKDNGCPLPIHADETVNDGFDYLSGKDFAEVNHAAESAMMEAHASAGLPVARVEVEKLNEETFGELLYFYMITCSISARMLNVNPFDQNGVEIYKKTMFKVLGKQ